MAVLALDSHGPWILQNRFLFFFKCTIYTYYILAFYKIMQLLLLYMEKNYNNKPKFQFAPMNSNLL